MNKVREWMVAVASGVVAFAVAWGATKANMDSHEMRITKIEEWKDEAIGKLGNIDAKLDLLLDANGITPQKRK